MSNIETSVKSTAFLRHCRGLNSCLRQCLFFSTRYTKEEKEKLKKYHALHGNDWKKISEMMSRSNLSVAMKYSEIKSRT